jgi:hypothetical protein
MLNRYSPLILGMLGISTLAFSGAGASAMLPLAPAASGEANTINDRIVQVKHMNNGRKYGMNWNKKNFNKCFYNNGGCYHKHRHNHFDRSYLYLPLIIGGFGAYNSYDYDDNYGYAGLSSAHVRWCLNRYRSYNPRTNLWVSFSGKKHQCDSPYY